MPVVQPLVQLLGQGRELRLLQEWGGGDAALLGIGDIQRCTAWAGYGG